MRVQALAVVAWTVTLTGLGHVPVLSQAVVTMSIATTLLQVKAAAQGSPQDLLLVLIAAVLAMAGAAPPDYPQA